MEGYHSLWKVASFVEGWYTSFDEWPEPRRPARTPRGFGGDYASRRFAESVDLATTPALASKDVGLMSHWPPPGDRKVPRREGEYSIPRAKPPEPEPPPSTVSPAEISTVGEIVARLELQLGQRLEDNLNIRLARIEAAAAGHPAVAQLSAELTLSQRKGKFWKALGAVLALCGALAGSVTTKVVVDPPQSQASADEVVDRVDALEERFARIERKLDRLLPP